MGLLYMFEKIRNPFLDQLMCLITEFGYETVFLVVALCTYWCISKKRGYYILVVGFWGLEINQLLKMIFRIPRPWVLDEKFIIVEKAREGAGGYSFPSGHTQNAVGVFGAIAKTTKGMARVLSLMIIILVSISRMYLGVHTPYDVGVSLLIGIVLLWIVYPILYGESEKNEKRMGILLLVMLLFSIFVTVFITLQDQTQMDAVNYADAIKTTYTILGAMIAMLICYYVEKKYVRFEEAADWKWQIIKLAGGLVLVLAIKAGLKVLFASLGFSEGIADMLRYMLIVIFAMVIWPAVFMKFQKKEKI